MNMNLSKASMSVAALFSALVAFAGNGGPDGDGVTPRMQRWQQRVEYKMDIDMDVEKYKFKGKQTLLYSNNSPDTLTKVFYHLYFNAFQPGTQMDYRLQEIVDPDPRMMKDMGDKRVSKMSLLKSNEYGYQKIEKLSQDGLPVKFEVNETILEVTLNEPILPGQKTKFFMEFEGQVPNQIRRSGRKSDEGVELSMTQWYPKLCEYDYQGWHSNPYLGREYYGVWGDFDVKLTMDSRYVVGGTGYVQNPNEVGHGYQDAGKLQPKGKKITWHFFAPNVHDFAWAADPDYVHRTVVLPGTETVVHILYQNETELHPNWNKLMNYMPDIFSFANRNYGKYPYKQFTILQGGDGGMEYPMCTLVTGKRNLNSLVGVVIHELMHNWFYGVLGSNESLYPWMDEGFTNYATAIMADYVFNQGKTNPNQSSYDAYNAYTSEALNEPLTTHADAYITNHSYGVNSYNKGAVFLCQLEYILGKNTFDKGMLRYFDTWKFQHPNPNDFIRVMEKESGLELDWYLQYWMNTTLKIDYSIKQVTSITDKKEEKTAILLIREGNIPMPLDVAVKLKDGSTAFYNIPLDLMRGVKPAARMIGYYQMPDWMSVYKDYELIIDYPASEIEKIIIDPDRRMADVTRENNTWSGK